MLNIVQQFLFGCTVKNITTQFGFNQNPTIYTVGLIREDGQLCTLVAGSTRKMTFVKTGALEMHGLIQSFDESIIDVKGSGVFDVKITDTKPVLDAVQVFITPSVSNLNLGINAVVVGAELVRSATEGIAFSSIKTAIESQNYKFGDSTFSVNLDDLILPNRGTNVEYKIKGSALSLMQVIQQTSKDNGLEWFIETVKVKDFNYLILVKSLKKTTGIVTLDSLVGSNEVIRKNIGRENSDDITKTILLGSQKQFLSNSSGSRWKQFWGFDTNGLPLTRPTFTVTTHRGRVVQKITTEADIRAAINGSPLSFNPNDPVLRAIISYGEEFWGRKFYLDINPSFIDSEGKSWVEPINAAMWEGSSRRPANILNSLDVPRMLDKFGTNDGRWTSFIKLPSPSIVRTNFRSPRWDDRILTSPNVLAAHNNRFYMKVSVERVGTRLIMTLPTALIVTDTRTPATNDQPICDSDNEQKGSNANTGNDRATRIADSWIAVLDIRNMYGPFTFEIPGLNGKTDITIDSSISPWTFGFRDISFTDAVSRMTKVAQARLKSVVSGNPEIGTIQLDTTGFPTHNLGVTLENETNLTNISVQFGVGGVKTSYRAILFTNEINRQNRRYQDLVDRLTREVQLIRNTHFTLPNFSVLSRQALIERKSRIEILQDNSQVDELARKLSQATLASVEKRDSENNPLYSILFVQEVETGAVDEFGDPVITLRPITSSTFPVGLGGGNPGLISGVRNRGEFAGRVPRVLPGTIVTIIRDCNNPNNFYFDLKADFSPTSSIRIKKGFNGSASNNFLFPAGHPLYEVEESGPTDPRFSTSERLRLAQVPNIGEPVGAVARLPFNSNFFGPTVNIIYDLNWQKDEGGDLFPVLNVTPNLFRDPQ